MASLESALAGLAEDVGQALLAFADRLRDVQSAPVVAGPAPGPRLGATQTALLEVVAAAGETGLTAREAAKQMDMPQSNATRALKALADRGIITGSGETPAVWKAVTDA